MCIVTYKDGELVSHNNVVHTTINPTGTYANDDSPSAPRGVARLQAMTA